MDVATIHTTKHGHGSPCPCGCAPCPQECCRLECLVAPRFFCGQLLTDRDLSALVGWTRDKLRLGRFRTGWGVVCGLDVRCDASRPGSVVVDPGYAVSCCGDDIVVCHEQVLDLHGVCVDPVDPCEDVPRRRKPREDEREWGEREREWGEREREWSRHRDRDRERERDWDRRELHWHRREREEELRAVDIFVAYEEEHSEPQTAVGRAACGSAGECEFSRTHEKAVLSWQPAATDPVTAAVDRWREAYDECLEVVRAYRARFDHREPEAEEVRLWLARWIEAHGLNQFCFVRDLVCSRELDSEEDVAELLFLLVQDCRNALTACGCRGCDSSHGVPLARVWIAERERRRERCCEVAWIDPYPPFRRPLGPECWPAPLGCVNGGQVLWHRAEDACRTLSDRGVEVSGWTEFVIPPTVRELERMLACDPFLCCEEPRTIQVFNAGVLGRRVVGFCGGGRIGLTVEKVADTEEAEVGSTVEYTVRIENTGDVALEIEASDDHSGEVLGVSRLEAGAHRTHRYAYEVELEDGPSLKNVVHVRGRADDGRSIRREDSCRVQIVRRKRDEDDVVVEVVEDDFTEIRNIGEARAERLRMAGIVTFDQLANAEVAALLDVFNGMTEEAVLEIREAAAGRLES